MVKSSPCFPLFFSSLFGLRRPWWWREREGEGSGDDGGGGGRARIGWWAAPGLQPQQAHVAVVGDVDAALLISSQIGVLIGLGLLQLLSGNLVNILRMLLGVTIIGCAFLLLSQKGKRDKLSGERSMYVAGGLSGLLGGLFSTSGPPIVYHLYREPLPAQLIRQCLLVLFLANTVLRLGIVISMGELSKSSIIVAAFAVPMVAGVTWLLAKYPPPLPVRMLQWLVCTLLMLAGVSMLISAF